MQMVVELAAAPSRTSAVAGGGGFRSEPAAERGICYAFQRGECDRGATCKFSHDSSGADAGGGSSFLTLVGEAADEAITRTVACALLFREESAIEALTADSLMATPLPPSLAVVVVAEVGVSLLASASPIRPANVTVGRIVVSPMRWAMSQETGVVPLPRSVLCLPARRVRARCCLPIQP